MKIMLRAKIARFFIFLLLLSSLVRLQLLSFQQVDSPREATSDLSLDQAKHHDQALQKQLEFTLTLPAFGFDNLLADWTFLNFLQYFGDSDQRTHLGHALSLDFFAVIVDRDPYFIDTYLYLTNSISIYAGQPLESIRLMEKGLVSLTPQSPPRSFFVWRHKATDELLFLGDTQAAKKSYETAASWAEQSPAQDATLVARLSRQTVHFLEADPNSRPAQINAWSEVLLRATDENIKQAAISQIEQLGGTILVSKQGQVTVRYFKEP